MFELDQAKILFTENIIPWLQNYLSETFEAKQFLALKKKNKV
jgi:hypothetical protein